MGKVTYLDHAGATQASQSQMAAIAAAMMDPQGIQAMGNPHSRHAVAQNTASMIQVVKLRILQFFGVSKEDYAVVFTGNTSDGLRIVADIVAANLGKDKNLQSISLLKDSHTSVHGTRQRLDPQMKSTTILGNDLLDLKTQFSTFASTSGTSEDLNLLFLTAQSNFCGKKYDPEFISWFRETSPGIPITCLDAAAYCSTSPLALGEFGYPDFVVVSFYKIFGFPTGVGGLLIRKDNNSILHKLMLGPVGFFGGAVEGYDVTSGAYVLKEDLEERFEVGTVNYHGIYFLKFGFDDIQRFGGMTKIQSHTFALAQHCVKFLRTTLHSTGTPVGVVYGWQTSSDEDSKSSLQTQSQGPIVAFNLLRQDGITTVGYTEVEKFADLFGICLRTGCFCNQGACDVYLGHQEWEDRIAKGKKCGDTHDLDPTTGKPLGCCRISFGRTSTWDDVRVFEDLILTCFVSHGSFSAPKSSDVNQNCIHRPQPHLTNMFLYPVKSGGSLSPQKWLLTATGLYLDRQWSVVAGDGSVVTQKRVPALCNVLPRLGSPKSSTLILTDKNDISNVLALSTEVPDTEADSQEAKICAGSLLALDCGDQAESYLTRLHPTMPPGSRIVRHVPCAQEICSSFNNVADYLLITMASIRALSKTIDLPTVEVMHRFRANFVIDTGSDVPFAEDTYSSVSIGGVNFEVIGRCTRCQMIAIDQATGEKDPTVLLALRNARIGDKMTFGVYLKQSSPTRQYISCGDYVTVTQN